MKIILSISIGFRFYAKYNVTECILTNDNKAPHLFKLGLQIFTTKTFYNTLTTLIKELRSMYLNPYVNILWTKTNLSLFQNRD